jgi:hypothetical protein
MAYTDEPEGDEYICEFECPHTCRCEQGPCICQCDWEERHETEQLATDSFLMYMTQHVVWSDPMQGAVSPALGLFFRFCNPELPALVHWVRWLLMRHETDKGCFFMDEDRAEELVEAMILSHRVDDHLANQMRRALYEGYGERDPDQRELFSGEEVA